MLAARSFAELVIAARRAEASPGDPFVSRRAAVVAAIGPLVFTTGFAWTLLGLLLTPVDFYWRTILFDPAHQLMVAGTLISIICLPVAKEMLESTAADLSAPDFAPSEPVVAPRPGHRRPRRHRRGPA